MTSAEFATVPLSFITVNREERQRRVLDANYIDSLAESISKRGLIHPPVLDRSGILVVGECRVAAIRKLGWTSVPIQYIDELDPAALRAVELEENIRRKAIEWKDECLAVKELHDMHRAEDPTWSLEDTGKTLGMSRPSISDHLAVAKEILNGNERVVAAPKYSTAKGIVSRTAERARTAASVAIAETVNPTKEIDPIITADFREWAPTYSGPKFNFIHCDFPYGIGADKFVQGAAPTHGGYEDSESTYINLLTVLQENADCLFDEQCHIMFWFSMHHYELTISHLEYAGFIIDPFPLIWLKSDNVGIIPDPERGPRRIYETAFFGSRGDRKIVKPVANAVYLPSDRQSHMSVKPTPMLSHFFQLFVDESTTMLDPTCGGGSSLLAARAAGAKSVLGIESNLEFADRARLALKAAKIKT